MRYIHSKRVADCSAKLDLFSSRFARAVKANYRDGLVHIHCNCSFSPFTRSYYCPFFPNLYCHFTAKKPTGTAPEIAEPLKDVTVVEGEPATLECELKGEPQPDIEWFRDGKQLEESKRVRMEFDGEVCSLTLKPSELDDEGEYKCVARNELGSASTKAELLVNEANRKPEFTQELKNIIVQPGEEARFEVRLIGSPPPEVDWFKGKKGLEDEGRFVMVDEVEEGLFALIIEDAQPDDSGEYKCVAFNELGEVSCNGNLVVEEKLIAPQLADEAESAVPVLEEEAIIAPEIAEEAESAPIVIEKGDDVSLSADVKGHPKPDVEWLKDGKEVKSSDHFDVGEVDGKHALLIKDATLEDSGVYKCQASSKGGVAERTFDVQVTGR